MSEAQPVSQRPALVVCGILQREVEHLVAQNSWPVDLRHIDSSLHVDFNRLGSALTGVLSRLEERPKILVYGTCHPLMEQMLAEAGARRTPGQNCVELILGSQRFNHELSQGAFFLFEDWARRWRTINRRVWGDRVELMRDIFRDAHRYLLAIRTPCSQPFTAEAEEVSELVGLPLRWTEVDLGHLEQCLLAVVAPELGPESEQTTDQSE